MGYKNVCLNCRIAKNLGTDYDNFHDANCSHCGAPMVFVNHSFRPPKKTDSKSWEVVKYLINHGFKYKHLNDFEKGSYATYPKTMKEAEEFVIKFKGQLL